MSWTNSLNGNWPGREQITISAKPVLRQKSGKRIISSCFLCNSTGTAIDRLNPQAKSRRLENGGYKLHCVRIVYFHLLFTGIYWRLPALCL
jgi:hypothetical protein